MGRSPYVHTRCGETARPHHIVGISPDLLRGFLGTFLHLQLLVIKRDIDILRDFESTECVLNPFCFNGMEIEERPQYMFDFVPATYMFRHRRR